MRPRALRPLLALAAVAAAAALAPAEIRPPETVALGWLTERADAVVLARAAEERSLDPSGFVRELDLLVDEPIRGSLERGSTAVVAWAGRGEAPPWSVGATHLAFLKALPAEPGAPARWALLSGPFGIRPIPESGPETRLPGIARAVASFLDGEGRIAKPAEYREALVAWMEDPEPGIAWSAAVDFVRLEELRAGLTAEQGARVVASFAKRPVGKSDKGALALAVAATRHPSAGRALAESLDDPRARLVRGDVGEALRRLKDPAATRILVGRAEDESPAKRADVLQVLGTVGDVQAAAAVRAHVSDGAAEVRVEAAHALGLLARVAREADPAARLGGREPLERMAAAAAATDNQIRAAHWSLAQMDDPEAWAALRRIAAEDPRETARLAAERYLKGPRQSLVLR
jgi:HEAT repeat protein